MPYPRPARYRLALPCALALLAAACASMRKASKRTAYIHQKTENFVYDRPCEKVWPDARQLLFRKGYSIRDSGGRGQMTLETEWKQSDDQFQRVRQSRYLVQGIAPEEGKCRVRITRNERRADGDLESERDLEMEWRLLERTAPDRAEQIRAGADSSGKAAAN